MGSMGASVLKILQNAIASVRLVTQLVGSSVVFSVSFLSGLLCCAAVCSAGFSTPNASSHEFTPRIDALRTNPSLAPQ
jgi:hypothetical protein